MSVYLGQLGRMVELPYVTAQSVEMADTYSFETTLEGRVKAQARFSRPRRTWSVSADRYLARAQGTLAQFAQGAWGSGPFVWVSSDAQVTNMLTPDGANCNVIETAAATFGGPVMDSGGYWSPTSLLANGAGSLYFQKERVPVVAESWATGSVDVRGSGSRAAMSFFNSSGGFISTVSSPSGGSSSGMIRLSVSSVVPATAVSVSLFARSTVQATRPALTWTKEVFEWADGQGCPSAVVHSLSKDVQSAHYDPRGFRAANMGFTVTEVG